MLLDSIPFDNINENHLKTLIENKVPEDKTVDYKQALSVQKSEQKKEFLKDITSFSNTLGGHIVYGIKEAKGSPVDLCGMDVKNPDEEIQRLDNLIRDCTDPRIYGIRIKVVKLQNRKSAIIIRIPRSFNPPHMVKIDKYRLFYGRNSSGSYPLNADELRILFGLSDTIAKNAKDFRAERLSRIISGETPIPLLEGPKYVLHMIPFDSFRPGMDYDLSRFHRNPEELPNIHWKVHNGRPNFDGFVTYHGYINPSNPEPTRSYTQLFRNGIIESVDMEYNPTVNGNVVKAININYENRTIKAAKEFLKIQKELGVGPPIFLMLTLLQIKGIPMTNRTAYNSSMLPGIPLEQEHLVLPESILDNFESDVQQQMVSIFDIVLNAAALTREDVQ